MVARSRLRFFARAAVVTALVLGATLHDTGSKPLTPKEIRDGGVIGGWSTAVHLGYPRLRAAGAHLSADGVPFLDASKLFAARAEELYYDGCHFNGDGHRLLAEAIGPALFDRTASAEH
jgi:lysophospholipase L1-like esterase